MAISWTSVRWPSLSRGARRASWCEVVTGRCRRRWCGGRPAASRLAPSAPRGSVALAAAGPRRARQVARDGGVAEVATRANRRAPGCASASRASSATQGRAPAVVDAARQRARRRRAAARPATPSAMRCCGLRRPGARRCWASGLDVLDQGRAAGRSPSAGWSRRSAAGRAPARPAGWPGSGGGRSCRCRRSRAPPRAAVASRAALDQRARSSSTRVSRARAAGPCRGSARPGRASCSPWPGRRRRPAPARCDPGEAAASGPSRPASASAAAARRRAARRRARSARARCRPRCGRAPCAPPAARCASPPARLPLAAVEQRRQQLLLGRRRGSAAPLGRPRGGGCGLARSAREQRGSSELAAEARLGRARPAGGR